MADVSDATHNRLILIAAAILCTCALGILHWEADDKGKLDAHTINYADPNEAYWGKPTAAIDWCETNYEYSRYVAEWWNTLSSGVLVASGLLGMYQAHVNKYETRFMMCYMSLVVIGFGSILFHGTLLYELQMADELPMLWGSLVWSYIIVNNECERGLRHIDWHHLAAYGTVVTVLFIYITDDLPALFQLHILIQAVWAVRNVCQMLEALPRNDDHEHAKFVFRLYGWCGVFGFACWLIENSACSHMQNLPGGIPNPQLHAWWHVFMAINTYAGPMFVAYHRGIALGKTPIVHIAGGILPSVQYLDEVKVE